MERREIRSVIYGIVITVYTVIAYDIFQELAKTPIDWYIIGVKVIAGLGSLGVGVLVFAFLIYKNNKI